MNITTLLERLPEVVRREIARQDLTLHKVASEMRWWKTRGNGLQADTQKAENAFKMRGLVEIGDLCDIYEFLHADFSLDTFELCLVARQNVQVEEDEQTILFFDVETLRTASEVGGFENAAKMGFGVAVSSDGFNYTTHESARSLKDAIRKADKIVTYNGKSFDMRVLFPDVLAEKLNKNHVDIAEIVHGALGRRLPLSAIGEALGVTKVAENSSLAPAMLREGCKEEVIAHCKRDVEILVAAYNSIATKGKLPYVEKLGKTIAEIQLQIPTV